MKEETPDEKDDAIKTTTTNLEAAGSSSSKPEIKDEPVDDVKETKPTPTKDPLAEAMNEVSTFKEIDYRLSKLLFERRRLCVRPSVRLSECLSAKKFFSSKMVKIR